MAPGRRTSFAASSACPRRATAPGGPGPAGARPRTAPCSTTCGGRTRTAAAGMAALGCTLRQYLSGGPMGQEGAEMRLQPVQLRRWPAVRRPANTDLEPAARGTAKPRKPHRDLAEQRRHRMVSAVFHRANPATARACRPPNSVLPGLRGDELPLNARQQQLRFGQCQAQAGDVARITGPVDLRHVHARPLALSPRLHQPQHPSHASILGQRTDAKLSNLPVHPQSCDGRLGKAPLRSAQAAVPTNGATSGFACRSRLVSCVSPASFWSART